MAVHFLLLLLTGATYGLGALVLRIASRRPGTTTWGTALYVGAVPLAVALLAFRSGLDQFTPAYAALMVLAGALGIGAVWATSEALRRGPVALTVLVQNYGLAIPVVASVLLYREPMGPLRIAGLAVVGLSIPLLQRRGKGGPSNATARHVGAGWLLYVVLALAMMGSCATLLRDATHRYADDDVLMSAILLAYVGNMVGSGLGLALTRTRPRRADILWGSLAGLSNFVAFICTMRISEPLGAVVVLPGRYVISMVLLVTVGWLALKEPLDGRALAGILLGSLGIILLSIPAAG